MYDLIVMQNGLEYDFVAYSGTLEEMRAVLAFKDAAHSRDAWLVSVRLSDTFTSGKVYPDLRTKIRTYSLREQSARG